MPKVVRPVKVVRVAATVPRPLLLVHRNWTGPAVVLGEGDAVSRIDAPSQVVVPLLPNRGKVGREHAAGLLRQAAPGPSEIYLVAVETSAGVVGYGMLAVPVAVTPSFTTARTL